MGYITLQSTGVNSGTAVDLSNAEFTFGWKNLTRADPVEGKYDIVEADTGGFENPILVLKGAIDIDETTSNVITEELLKSFAKETDTDVNLQIRVGNTTPRYIKGNAGTDSIKVQIMDYTLKGSPKSDQGHWIDFTINLRETA